MELFFGPTPHRPTDGLLKIARGVGKHRSAIFSSSPVSWLSYRCAWVKWKKHKNCNSLFLSVISHNINNMQTRAVPQLWAVLEKGGNCFSTVYFLWIRTFRKGSKKVRNEDPENADRLKKRSRMRHWKDSLEGLLDSC